MHAASNHRAWRYQYLLDGGSDRYKLLKTLPQESALHTQVPLSTTHRPRDLRHRAARCRLGPHACLAVYACLNGGNQEPVRSGYLSGGTR